MDRKEEGGATALVRGAAIEVALTGVGLAPERAEFATVAFLIQTSVVVRGLPQVALGDQDGATIINVPLVAGGLAQVVREVPLPRLEAMRRLNTTIFRTDEAVADGEETIFGLPTRDIMEVTGREVPCGAQEDQEEAGAVLLLFDTETL